MAKQVLYKDLGKRTNDLLTKDFPSEKQENKIEYIGKAPNQVTFETSFTARKDGSIFGVFTPKYKFFVNGNVPTQVLVELTTKKEFKTEVTLEDALTKNLKTIITGQTKDDETFGTLALEYKHEVASANFTADYGKTKGSTLKGGIVIGSKGISLGATSEYFLGTEDSNLKEFALTVAYSAADFDVTAFGRIDSRGDEDKNEFGATYFHRVNADLAVGTEIVFDTANPEVKPKLAFGTQYKYQEDTLFKTKFDTTGKVGLSYQQKINKNVKLTLASTVDTNNLNAKGASTLGFTLSLTD